MSRLWPSELITKTRTDLSRYLLHWTTKQGLLSILRDGFLVATFAWRPATDEQVPTVWGERPAVCFADVPIGNYLQATMAAPNRYQRWGVALPKKRLYGYGARPVWYADKCQIRNLLEYFRKSAVDERYLLAHYEPDSSDWTHEREWRALPNNAINEEIGLSTSLEVARMIRGRAENVSGCRVVPIHLPDCPAGGQLPEEPEFVLLVDTEEDRKKMDKWQHGQTALAKTFRTRQDCAAAAKYRDRYVAALAQARVISFETVRDRRDRDGLWRLEDLLDATESQIGLPTLWDRASVTARRGALSASGIEVEGHDYQYRDWSGLCPGSPALSPGPSEKIAQSTDAMTILCADVGQWIRSVALSTKVGDTDVVCSEARRRFVL